MTIRLSNYEVRHFERPDSSFPEYERYFGAEEDEIFEPVDDYEMDKIVDYYAKMGPADDDYMEEVMQKWAK